MECTRCGGDVGNGSLLEAVVVSALDDQGVCQTLFLCLRNDDSHERCATRVITKAATAKFNDGEGISIHPGPQ